MGGYRPVLGTFARVCAVYAAFLLFQRLSDSWKGAMLETASPVYGHCDIIDVRLTTRDRALRARWRLKNPRAIVLRGPRPIETVAGIRAVLLSWDGATRAFVGRWPCPWNAADGEYTLALVGEQGLGPRLKTGSFRIARRPTAPIPPRFTVLTWESVRSLADLQVRGPDGKVGDWKGLLDWVRFAEADGLWMLIGQTPGKAEGETWVKTNLDMVPKVAEECKHRGLQFGVYAMDYLTVSATNRVPGYEYALEIEDGELAPTRAISLREPRRPSDVAALLKRFRDVPGVTWLGLDYVRNALGGYELIDEFYAEMPGVSPPPEWGRLTRRERALWFARKKVLRKDKNFIDAWQWWRAHKVCGIIRRIKAEIGDSKPLWAFTLTWERGWQHGQDPVMFRDAGVDLDALMMYEADSDQFESIVKDWRSYVKRSDVNLMVGDVVDLPLHQNSARGPGELYYRLARAVDGIHSDGPPAGLFVHDLERALHGRLGGYSTRQWMEQVRGAIRHFKAAPGPGRAKEDS